MSEAKDEWLRLMNELARVDREEFRLIRTAAWSAVAGKHERKSVEEIAAWVDKAS